MWVMREVRRLMGCVWRVERATKTAKELTAPILSWSSKSLQCGTEGENARTLKLYVKRDMVSCTENRVNVQSKSNVKPNKLTETTIDAISHFAIMKIVERSQLTVRGGYFLGPTPLRRSHKCQTS